MKKVGILSPSIPNKFSKKLRGVNLGGWLVLEKWMTPSIFEGLKATDETSYCVELGKKAEQSIKNHWNTFITAEDFAWLASICLLYTSDAADDGRGV
jgi:glucan 1,3-beta-glucosidase